MSARTPLPSEHTLVDVVPLGGAPGVYTYAVRPSLATAVVPGRRVLVPFGTRRRAGIVLGDGRPPAAGTLKEVDDVLDDGPLVVPEVLSLVRWASEYYAAPLSHALRAALPPGSEVEEKRTPVLTKEGRQALEGASIAASVRRALTAIQLGKAGALSASALGKLVRDGLVSMHSEISSVGGDVPTLEWVVRTVERATIPARNTAQLAVWRLLEDTPALPLEAIQARVPNARDAVRRMERRRLVIIERRPLTLASSGAFASTETMREATEEQASALETLVGALGDKARTFLLEGVTGSGKTEVYLRLIARARQMGRTALVLVPEIALTPQISARFRARFGPEVAVLHSGLTERDRQAEWHRVRRGEAPIVVGARSAVFAPLQRPAVIIVDEEHDASFKQAEGLRYHGRDLAVVRAQLAGAVCVLGSATPSLETMHNASVGRYGHIRLRNRVDARPMPEVSLIDLRGKARDKPVEGVAPSGLLSVQVVSALQETLARGEQAIVFLNRRGHSTALMCRDCGQVHRCESCAVAMTWHEQRERLVCHYCGAREPVLDECLNCGSTRLLLTGAGTEKLEEELAVAITGARIGRLDRDVARSTTNVESILAKFAAGDVDVLVGTQMVAKGHDFPGVTLVCVLVADGGLNQPDFRASESTAQLLTQVAGRAGRGKKPGRVLVQTFNPDAAAIQAVVGHDYARFAFTELEERREAGYPPFMRTCLILVSSEREEEASRIASILARAASPRHGDGHEILGPAPAALAKLRKRHRFQFLVKARKPSEIRTALRRMDTAKSRVPTAVRVVVDIDPVDML